MLGNKGKQRIFGLSICNSNNGEIKRKMTRKTIQWHSTQWAGWGGPSSSPVPPAPPSWLHGVESIHFNSPFPINSPSSIHRENLEFLLFHSLISSLFQKILVHAPQRLPQIARFPQPRLFDCKGLDCIISPEVLCSVKHASILDIKVASCCVWERPRTHHFILQTCLFPRVSKQH